jgi:hypothetical protein
MKGAGVAVGMGVVAPQFRAEPMIRYASPARSWRYNFYST